MRISNNKGYKYTHTKMIMTMTMLSRTEFLLLLSHTIKGLSRPLLSRIQGKFKEACDPSIYHTIKLVSYYTNSKHFSNKTGLSSTFNQLPLDV